MWHSSEEGPSLLFNSGEWSCHHVLTSQNDFILTYERPSILCLRAMVRWRARVVVVMGNEHGVAPAFVLTYK